MAITIISYCMIKPINNSINRSVFGHYIPAVIAFPVYWFGYQIILKLMNVNDWEAHTYQQLALAKEMNKTFDAQNHTNGDLWYTSTINSYWSCYFFLISHLYVEELLIFSIPSNRSAMNFMQSFRIFQLSISSVFITFIGIISCLMYFHL